MSVLFGVDGTDNTTVKTARGQNGDHLPITVFKSLTADYWAISKACSCHLSGGIRTIVFTHLFKYAITYSCVCVDVNAVPNRPVVPVVSTGTTYHT